MADEQRRVLFDFAGTREVQYLGDLPELGDLVSHGGELWVVRRVRPDDVDVVITCAPATTRHPEPGLSGIGDALLA